MTAQSRTRASALDEFLPELDVRRDTRDLHVDPREIHLEPVGLASQLADGPSGPMVLESSRRAQLWPMLAAALVGIGATILAFVAFSTFAL